MFSSNSILFHHLQVSKDFVLPKQFTFPFNYTPHPLCVKAVAEVQQHLEQQHYLKPHFDALGKMFGVLVVENKSGQLGYLKAFSGKLAESNFIEGFVPPVFNTLNKEGFYKQGEQKLNAINSDIERLETSETFVKAKRELETLQLNQKEALAEFKTKAKQAKAIRKEKREQANKTLSETELNLVLKQLEHESKRDHFQLKDLKREQKQALDVKTKTFKNLQAPILQLKQQRRELSAKVQKQLHQSYQFLNANGGTKDLLDIFEVIPPAGAGECAAPKLLQYAYQYDLKPIAMAEFWWGKSPDSQVRKHQQFYPSCRSKCEPILGFMLQGLNVEPNPMQIDDFSDKHLETVYEDEHLIVVNKPHDFLSVPGKSITDSVQTRLQAEYPNAILVHRLDFSTSGLLVAAKSETVYKHLQQQFTKRTVNKRYVAVLDGEVETVNGYVDLPLRVDLDNRPQQLVCFEHGKSARTRFEVVSINNGKTRINFYPVTGRTHQLRVHASHPQGLNCEIVGDDLYGQKNNRLHLHAERLEFIHPVTNILVSVICEVPF